VPHYAIGKHRSQGINIAADQEPERPPICLSIRSELRDRLRNIPYMPPHTPVGK
jgi:hypothetical protein